MKPLVVYLLITLFLSHVARAELHMKQWTGPAILGSWGEERTWKQIYSLKGYSGGKTINQKGVMQAAQIHYQWLIDNGKKNKGDRTLLVSALYIPTDQRLYLSTIPKQPLKRLITGALSRWDTAKSPWFREVGGMWTTGKVSYKEKKNTWHAEDGCYFLYETQGEGLGIETRNVQGVEGRMCPEGSIIATYGNYDDEKGPSPIGLCGLTTETRDKPQFTCQNIANRMGLTSVKVVTREGDGKVVNYRADPNPNPDGAIPDLKWYDNCDSLVRRSNQRSPMLGSFSMQRRESNDSCAYDPVTTAVFDFPLPEECLAPATEIATVPLTLTVYNNATTTQSLATSSTDASNATSGPVTNTPGSTWVNSTVGVITVTTTAMPTPLTVTAMNISITTLLVTTSNPPIFRDGDTLAPSATSNIASVTNVPAPSCTMRKEDPDQGISSPLCLCEDSITLPLLPAATSLPHSASCAYTSLPPSPTSNNGPEVVTVQPKVWPVTDIHGCQVCTLVINDKARCTSIPSCTPSTPASVTTSSSNSPAATAKVTIGSSMVQVGTLTSTALSASITSALRQLCPMPTSGRSTACATSSVVISSVAYVKEHLIYYDGELVVHVEASSYNNTNITNGMIDSVGTAVQGAAAKDASCNLTEHQVTPSKRWHGLVGEQQSNSSFPPPMRFLPRVVPIYTPHKPQYINLCNTIGFVNVNYWTPWSGKSPTDYLAVYLDFELSPDTGLDCGLLELAADLFAVVAPEFTAEDIALVEELVAICEKAEAHGQ